MYPLGSKLSAEKLRKSLTKILEKLSVAWTLRGTFYLTVGYTV